MPDESKVFHDVLLKAQKGRSLCNRTALTEIDSG
jgi:hypothetical protein